MKYVFLILFMVFGSFAMAEQDCPSVDETIRNANIGSASSIDISQALLCHLNKANSPLCNTRVGIYKDILLSVEERFRVGELTIEDVDKAKQDVADAVASCPEPVGRFLF